MGMYTELVLAVELDDNKIDLPFLQLIDYMISGEGSEPVELPNHDLFKTDRWDFMLRSNSYYFVGKTRSEIINDPISGYSLEVRCNLKNYDSEIEKFIDWISYYVPEYEKDLAGYYRYEEDRLPIWIFFNKQGDIQNELTDQQLQEKADSAYQEYIEDQEES